MNKKSIYREYNEDSQHSRLPQNEFVGQGQTLVLIALVCNQTKEPWLGPMKILVRDGGLLVNIDEDDGKEDDVDENQ